MLGRASPRRLLRPIGREAFLCILLPLLYTYTLIGGACLVGERKTPCEYTCDKEDAMHYGGCIQICLAEREHESRDDE